ncbi:hypothetical protein COP1_002638 [Malus domestica]
MTRKWLKMKAEEKNNLERDPPAPPTAGCCIISRIEKMGSSQFLNVAERCRISSNSSPPILYLVRLIGYIKQRGRRIFLLGVRKIERIEVGATTSRPVRRLGSFVAV